MSELVVESNSESETLRIGTEIGKAAEAGDLILLRGDLGGGKTTFTRGLVAGLGHPDPREVASPTFAIHHRYDGGRLPINHVDLYRLESSPVLARQGILDPILDQSAVTVVEWADRLTGFEGDVALEADFAHRGPDRRTLHFRFRGLKGARLRRALTRK
jgi:tRNA threonylcarbamoyladenosine biosynthesis protein TsaE